MEFQDWIFDQRVLERNIRKGLVTRKDYEKYLHSLQDTSTNLADPEEDLDLLHKSNAGDYSEKDEMPEDGA